MVEEDKENRGLLPRVLECLVCWKNECINLLVIWLVGEARMRETKILFTKNDSVGSSTFERTRALPGVLFEFILLYMIDVCEECVSKLGRNL